jgi:uncharacterized protein YecT (DUF1311 family)
MVSDRIRIIHFLDDKLNPIFKSNFKPMKTYIISILLALPMAVFSQSQSEMNAQADKDYAKADKELNTVYQQVIKKYAKNTLFIKHMKAAQLAWINFRDAEFRREFPKFMNGQVEYGSMFSLERSTFMQELTEQRTITLKRILKEGPR